MPKPGQSIEDAYRDLLDRAEQYFHRVYPSTTDADKPPAGVKRWLLELQEARMWEAIEHHQLIEQLNQDDDTDPDEEIDVPL